MKKVLLITATILVLILCGAYLYFNNTPIQNQPEPLQSVGVIFRDYFPLGGEPVQTENQTPEENTEASNETPSDTPIQQVAERLVQLSNFSISGFDFGSKILTPATSTSQKKTVPVLRYIEKATGHVFERELPTGTPTKIANTTIPGSHEAFLAGSTVIYRYLDDGATIRTFAGTLPTPEEDGSLPEMKGVFFPDNISALTISPDQKKLFYILPFDTGVLGNMSEPDGTKKIKLFDSAFSGWLTQWQNQNTITLTTKASGVAPGYAYLLDVTKKTYSRLLGDIPGLTTLVSPNSKYVLYSESVQNGFLTKIYNVVEGTSIPLAKGTLPEKCVWSSASDFIICAIPETIPGGLYPDVWYQGKTSFIDTFWQINPATGSSNFIQSPFEEKRLSIDAISLRLDQEKSHIYFINKNDETLWQLSLTEPKPEIIPPPLLP
jgi:hypothetical protein